MQASNPTPVLGLWVYSYSPFKDYRGQYTEIFNKSKLISTHEKLNFLQDDAIVSTYGVLRGYHGDNRTHKLITCLYGSFLMDVACINPKRAEFGKHETLFMDSQNPIAVIVPPGYVNAHFCLSDECIFFYKQTSLYFGEKYQYTIRWNEWDVAWPAKPTLSERDERCQNTRNRYVYRTDTDVVLLNPEEVNK